MASSRSGGGSGPGLYRRAFGSNEKWTIVRADGSKGSSPVEVGTGSKIMLRNDKDERYLAVRKGKNSAAAHWKVVALSKNDLEIVDEREDGKSTVRRIVLKPHTPATCIAIDSIVGEQ